MCEHKLVALLKERGLTVSTAESCTGGLIASKIINVAGCSSVYREGFITYANSAKMKYLNVSEDTLNRYGAVSQNTVIEMAAGCAKASGADVTIVTSGIAGPDGGSATKPVGLVHTAVYVNGEVSSKSRIYDGDRNTVRERAAEEAIIYAVQCIEQADGTVRTGNGK